jgi:spore maturation protein SpmB
MQKLPSEYTSALQRMAIASKSAISPALKTTWWIAKLTVMVSLAVTVLQYFGVITRLAEMMNPLFHLVGLPGEAALVYLTAYFVNNYSAIAVMVTLDFSMRTVTIVSVMCLCSHNMVIETAVQKKTGSSAVRMVLLRTVAALASALLLNWILPDEALANISRIAAVDTSLKDVALHWLLSTVKLLIQMTLIILSLNILQKLLAEFGIIRRLSKIFRPVLKIFGLPAKTSFLWIIANTLGLAYGAAVMIEETEQGKINRKDADLLNHHIAISHSNIEDVSLFFSVGASLWCMLIIRWILAAAAVWLRQAELRLWRKGATI